ncbi:alkaline phosphatase [Erythrobacter litoralis]|uniref:Alkaline phosphatase family protein n=1 Tax=Erythrobacter litoralis (strain HTCC2594) TaxID=314225 RepID=Q2N756_ERYLH|nr:alkaline phosphatase [Erythrobacter litoralis]ABC64485.1 alkaline phosphatase family protein [Erythrobacter litoralis HTCC2594]
MIQSRPALAALFATFALPLAGCGTAYAQDDVTSAPAPVQQAAETQESGKAKNVILFIGDGMGVSTVTAARIYAGQKLGQTGEEYILPFERFENVALVKTYNTNAQVPDSAGTATAMHSGKKTKIGFLGIGPEAPRADCVAGQQYHLPLIGEQAKERGLAVGVVSTARITHATPASVYARATERNWEADASMPEDQRGLGCDDIATQLVNFDFDVALGGGTASFFGADNGGRRLDAAADLPGAWVARTGGTYVTDANELSLAPAGKPVLGLFSPSHMTYMAEKAADNGEPTLTAMTREAIQRLAKDPDGYYLMVESGRIDHGHHWGKAGVALEEAVEFARAIQWAIENTDPEETLILVTADHSHVFTIAGYPKRGNPILGLVVPPEGEGDGGPILAEDGKPYTTLGYANGPGAVSGERPVPETGVMATQQALVPTGSETHAGEDVPLYAQGPGAERARGVIEQNVVYDIMVEALGWK